MRKRKIVAAAWTAAAGILLAACRTVGSAGDAGAASAPGAVQAFLAAAHNGDIRTMGSLFGTTSGPISSRDDANTVEKRMRALQCYLTHDSASVLEDRPGNGAERQLVVELRQRSVTRQTTFSAVRGPHDRWYVESFDISRVTDLCHP